MVVQQDFLGIQDLKELSPRRKVEVYKALEDLLSSRVETRLEAMDRLCAMDAHRRSPLVACFLVYRLIEPDLCLRARIAQCLSETIRASGTRERSPKKVRDLLHQNLRGIGHREVNSLLQLIAKDDELLEPVCVILNQCSSCGEILVEILNCHDCSIPIRMASCKVIGQIGFLEARQAIEVLEKRLAGRITGQLSMTFAPGGIEEAKELIPVLRGTLEALREASI
ncbi:MAG: hypothetical protein A2Z14_12225 [Chloroflexi bacterium RBG_16_48_8]|nr:MAG: hypothetical protein A2Z14_12225 [Chloroflexi bacterium RBG_16_48_8]